MTSPETIDQVANTDILKENYSIDVLYMGSKMTSAWNLNQKSTASMLIINK